MTYLFIFIALALILAPVFWIMPSPGMRRQEKLRQHALALGLQIKVCELPQSHRASVRREDTVRGVVYRLPWQGRQGRGDTYYGTCIKVDGGTECEGSLEAPVQAMMRNSTLALPVFCYGTECSNSGVGIFWQEQGDSDAVQVIHEKLTLLRQQLQELIDDK